MTRILSFFGLSLLVAVLSSCKDSAADPAYIQEINKWHQERVASLMAPDGWLALAGLYWLKPGANIFGSHSGLALSFPAKAPDTLGTFWLEADSVYLTMAPGLQARINDQAVEAYPLSGSENAPLVHYEDLSWILIQRSDRYGIRLWDRRHPKIADTVHIDRYPVDPAWRLPAKWLPDTSGHTIRIRNVLDMEVDMETEGRLRFEYQGKSYELTALDGGEDAFFMIFADATSGEDTYGGGRYLYTDRPDENGMTFLDFNKAYNPPCVFTDFATCPLPPAENRLDLAITAGELNYGAH